MYKYGYRLRPPSLGTEPKGYTKRTGLDGKVDGYWGYVYYDRKLRQGEKYAYDLDPIEEQDL